MTRDESPSAGGVTVLAPCKLNPFLEIVGRRPDGFHELVTTMLTLELADRIRVRPSKESGVRLTLSGPMASADIPLDERNLVVAIAQRALEQPQVALFCPGFEIELEKQVPSQAGLGGASSDAAACLHAIECVVGQKFEEKFRHASLAALGSDCVFFAEAETGFALCEGRGERVRSYPAPSQEWVFVVITPELRCPTGAVFAQVQQPIAGNAPDTQALIRMSELEAEPARALLFNRLEEAAQRSVPELGAWFECFEAAEASHFRLCGSGSSFFGLYSNQAEAEAARQRLLGLADGRSLKVRGSWVLKPARRGVIRI